MIDIDRDQLIHFLSQEDSSLQPTSSPTPGIAVQPTSLTYAKTRHLAQTYLNNIIVATHEVYTEEKARKIKNSFHRWKDDFTQNMEETASFSHPKLRGDYIKNHNITSLPMKWSNSNFWFTKTKEQLCDPVEKEKIQENLTQIAAADFSVVEEPTSDEDRKHLADPKFIATLSQLARGYAYHSPQGGETIHIYSPETGNQVEYSVEIIPLSLGIQAFGLTPQEGSGASPILLFRGTSFYPSGRAAGATIATDFDPLGVGYSTYKAGQERIRSWIDQAAEAAPERKVTVTGHSLGSAYATYAAIDNEQKVKAAYGFGATKVSFTYYKKWEAIQEREKDSHKPCILQFNAPGDDLSNFGHVRLATAVYHGTMDGFLPSVETIGKTKNQAIGKFTAALNKLRPKTTAHRVDYFGASLTLWKSKQREKPNWIGIALKVVAFIPVYIGLTSLLWTKRILIGSHERQGILTWPMYIGTKILNPREEG